MIQPGQRAGFPCPECNSFIQTDIPSLLRGQIFCSSCGLKLTPKLDEGLKQSLSTFKRDTDKAQKTKDEVGK